MYLFLPTFAVTFAVPAFLAVTFALYLPVDFTAATDLLLLDHLTDLLVPVIFNVTDEPASIVTVFLLILSSNHV